MRAFVFTDKALERYAGRFVWLAVDTENSTNTAFLKKYPINVWPTLLIIDPNKEAVALRYVGGATVPQLKKLLDDGAQAVGGAHSKADEALARADRLANDRKTAEAAAAYEEAIAAAPKRWSRLGRAAESLTFYLLSAKEYDRCANRALELYPPARLAAAYRAMQKWDEALPASDRALARVYGPRKIGIYRTRAEIYIGKGDKESARKTIEEAIRYAESLPEPQRSDATIASLKK